MRAQLVAYFEAHHKLVEAGALQIILTTSQPLDVSRRLIEAAGAGSPFVTVEMVESYLRRFAGPDAAAATVTSRIPSSPAAIPFQLLEEGFQAPAPSRDPKEAYEHLFAARYAALSRMLRGRSELAGQRPIAELARSEGNSAVVGMVREVRQTHEHHHLILTVEDPSGVTELFVPRESPAGGMTFLPDEVVGFSVVIPRERGKAPRVTGAQRPDVPVTRNSVRPTEARRALFLSDLHIGSRSFLDGPWTALAEFLRGDGPRPEVAAQIDHVVVAGDLVDGIGIYPGQERDLAISDVFQQYDELGKRLRELPERLNIVLLPGNHDAVCPAEPQPGLPREFRDRLPSHVRSVANPSTFALDGVVVSAYHGRSFDDLIPAIPGASYARPTEVMKRMLSMRHLAPIYGGRTPLAPLERDGLVLDRAPDILVTGHAHTYGVDRYRGVLLLNASTWQAETEYQRMRNISPVPARAAVVDLRDLSVETFDFSGAAA